jgi:hypothetical protein
MQPELREFRTNMGQAGENVRRIGVNLRQATGNVLEAGSTVPELAREAASVATERLGEVAGRATERLEEVAEEAGDRLGEVASEARERVGQGAREARRAALGVGIQLVHLPELVREGARRGVEAVENVGARAVVSVIRAGTRVLKTAAELVDDLSARRRVNRRALEELVVEQLRWAHAGTEAFDRAAAEMDDDETRVRLVRCKLQTIRQAEALTQLLRDIGGSVPAEEKVSPAPAPARSERGARGPAAARGGLAHGLTIAVQLAEGWRALGQIATRAQSERIADAISTKVGSIGKEPQEDVEFLREALLECTMRTVLEE